MGDQIGVMIVDDEYIVREDMRAIVDWEKLGFRILCEATNGRQGLELFLSCRPKLVITDIKMPVMDGLEMAEAILKTAPETKFILLTAYDEFDFARAAMRLGITQYLLKHEIDSETMEELLKKISDQSSEEDQTSWEGAALCARDLILGAVPQENGRKALEKMVKEGFLSLVLFQGGKRLSQQERRELMTRKEERMKAVPIMADQEIYTVLFAFQTPSELAYYHSISQYISQVMAGLGGQGAQADVAVSERWKDLQSVKSGYRRTLASLETAVFQKEHGRIIRGEITLCREIDYVGLYEFIMLMKTCLANRSYDRVYQECREYVLQECLPEKKVDQFRIWRTFLIGMLEEHNSALQYVEPFQLVHVKCESDTVFDFLEKLQELLKLFAAASGKDFSKNIRRAVAYINEHYTENITLEEVADVLGMNAMYTGQIFKKEMGISFKQYLAELRVEKAKGLLRSGNYKIYQVGEMVGYQSTQYFCSVFKKLTGVSPAEYEKQA